ncbi:MAG: RNA methyltransferase [candidate division KSB1 bacterium]|nr:RNA methyltransferase [candidate division KSB1 bacterium]
MRKKSLEEQVWEQAELAERLGPRRLPIVGVLDNIRSAYNVGAILRTADAARVEELIVCGISPLPTRNEVRKTALGAEESVPWRYVVHPAEAIRELRGRGYQIVVLEKTEPCLPLWEPAYRFPVALVVGNEWHGVRDDVLTLADAAVFIPMFGRKTSLNVAVAFGIAVYELVRRLDAQNWLKGGGQE